jgi:hypothetical protein
MKHGRWLGRVARGVRPDRNPLRRTSDRVEAFIFGGLIVVAAVGAPVGASVAGDWAHGQAARAAEVQRQTRHQVQAVLTEPPHASAGGFSMNSTAPAQALWIAPNGVWRKGPITVPADSAKGTAITVWTDQAGDVTSAPLTPAQVADQGTFATLATVALVLVGCLLTALATRVLVNRHRMAAWTAGWAVTAPRWNPQRW